MRTSTATLRQTRAAGHAKRALLARHHIVAPRCGSPTAAAASVFGAARLRGPIARDVIAQVTQLSIATVNRQVTALLDAGVLRERADLAVSGAIGRPRVPVEVNHEPFLTLGIHIGARTTSIVATDLFGRTLDVVETPTPRGAAGRRAGVAGRQRPPLPEPLAPPPPAVGRGGRRRRRRRHHRIPRPPAAGLVGCAGRPGAGRDAGPAGVGRVARRRDGRRRTAARCAPAARARSATSLYVYARETVGYALSIGGRVHSPASGPGTIAALPAHSELLGGSGQLESTVSDEAVLIAARKARIIPAEGPASTMTAVLRAARQGNEQARALLAERARVLGEAVALLRDMLNPDDLVVGGQAFTEYPEGMDLVEAAFTERSVLPPRDIRVTAFGNRVQEAGAGVVSLGGLYADPIGAMRRRPGPPSRSHRLGGLDEAICAAVQRWLGALVTDRTGVRCPDELPCCRCTPRRWPSPAPAMPAG